MRDNKGGAVPERETDAVVAKLERKLTLLEKRLFIGGDPFQKFQHVQEDGVHRFGKRWFHGAHFAPWSNGGEVDML